MKKIRLISIALAAVSFTSCSKEEKANLLVVHASPDAPGVDLLIENAVVNSASLTFPNYTGYLEIEAGTRNIKVNAAGTSTTVINADVNFTKDMYYSLFACNVLNGIEAVLFSDDLTAPAVGNAHVRFIHMSADAPAVDVALDGGDVVFSNVAFKQGTAFAPLAAGSYDLEVRVAGTQTVALDLDPITVADGKIYTVFAKGLLAGSGDQALGAQIIVNK
ncbi:MAG: DUF4397 domain-containing protein [Flavobacteriales bacterium]|nr:DUF4397 domain-containing protein [Flavobacteriales bacterium]